MTAIEDKARTLTELADRVEALSGPCRTTDALIAEAVGAKHGPDGGWCNDDNGDYWTTDECADLYTASMDAAMSLLPEGWFLELEQHSASWTASLASHLWFDDRRETVDGGAATPALALTAASLRSIASQVEG